MEVITRPCEPHITLTLLHLEPRAGQRKPRAPFKGVRGGSAKGHAERSDAISASSRASHTSPVWFPEWERVLSKLIVFPGFSAIGAFFYFWLVVSVADLKCEIERKKSAKNSFFSAFIWPALLIITSVPKPSCSDSTFKAFNWPPGLIENLHRQLALSVVYWTF